MSMGTTNQPIFFDDMIFGFSEFEFVLPSCSVGFTRCAKSDTVLTKSNRPSLILELITNSPTLFAQAVLQLF